MPRRVAMPKVYRWSEVLGLTPEQVEARDRLAKVVAKAEANQRKTVQRLNAVESHLMKRQR